ncbi:uncharacterized protein Z518_07904 [Rhinocladiella mackenziei CBS 650.93]|uniref:Major facilitator superfamily (MFS) profile domain-containing protein n=1 Tax=Rhinocladiella mackenziei CBS 650.93 TaxID=1442369 RepID=A0A0D2IZB5_9EURO|nr:uncharacterized protein Z518_07904 [Rhinocladiella mackenziei CBS 650.93]KIX01965.1 hypothetical protein Z518_07904 [Rhinocladiella mackenziei CBS 650.93]
MTTAAMQPKVPDAVECVEKIDSSFSEQGKETKSTDPYYDEEYTRAEQRRIIHKVDRRLVVGLGLAMAIALMDRTNLGSAAIAGMTVDLGLEHGPRYSLILLVFFIPFVLSQLPAAVVIRKVGPRDFITLITFCWGGVMMCFGFVHDWWVLIILRILIGILEAGLLPACILLLSCWYTRFDVHKRFSSFYLISSVGSAIAPVLACGFMQMGGLSGLAAWRWIFIMEGLLTIAVAFINWFLLVDYPLDAHKCWKFLTKKEEDYIIRRINRDRADANADHKFNLRQFIRPGKDWRVWQYAIIYMCGTAVAYSLSFFLPIILRLKLGYDVTAAQALSTPPYVFAGIFMYVEAWLGDKYHIRGPIIIWNCLQSICGLCLLGWVKAPGVQYFGIFLVASGVNGNVPATLAWQANNVRGNWKRAFCSALLIMGGGTGGVIGSLVFRSQDAPTYLPGIEASIVANVISIICAVVMMLSLYASNKKAAAGRTVLEELPGFRYTL